MARSQTKSDISGATTKGTFEGARHVRRKRKRDCYVLMSVLPIQLSNGTRTFDPLVDHVTAMQKMEN
jgi:hypothetical protein